MLNGMPSMSSDLPDRQWRFYVEDMLGFCDRVLRFNAGVRRENFAADPMRYDATVRNIELIGEAATHIPLVIREANPNVPWRMIIATRNQLIHGYAGIDDDVLWSIVNTDIPALQSVLREFNTAP